MAEALGIIIDRRPKERPPSFVFPHLCMAKSKVCPPKC